MDKNVAILAPGQGEERILHDVTLRPGTTVLEAVRATGTSNPNHFFLEDEQGDRFVSGQNLYEVAQSGAKYFLVQDQARVGK